jgi:hypothetical protein
MLFYQFRHHSGIRVARMYGGGEYAVLVLGYDRQAIPLVGPVPFAKFLNLFVQFCEVF